MIGAMAEKKLFSILPIAVKLIRTAYTIMHAANVRTVYTETVVYFEFQSILILNTFFLIFIFIL